jgi:hypothetical protein
MSSRLSGMRTIGVAVQAAIAATHASAPSVEATDWDRIAVLYEALGRVAPSPVVEQLNRAVAAAMATGVAQALAIVDELIALDRLPGSHLVATVGGELLARLGRRSVARAELEWGAPAVCQPARTLSAAAQGGHAGVTSPARRRSSVRPRSSDRRRWCGSAGRTAPFHRARRTLTPAVA